MNIDIRENDIIKDTYMDNDIVADRLYNEYIQYGNLIIAYDFDDTVFNETNKNNNHSQMIELIQTCRRLGFELIVYTCRPVDEYSFVIDYLTSHNIPFDKINEESCTTTFPKNDRKIFYNIFFDDRAGLKSAYESLVRCIDKLCKDGILKERG